MKERMDFLSNTNEKNTSESSLHLNQNKMNEQILTRLHQLEIENKELETFSYSVSHDLRAPLRAISGYSGILKRDFRDCLNEEGIKTIDAISENIKIMGQLIEDLLNFSRISKIEISNKQVDMKSLVDCCIQELTQSMPLTKHTITIGNIVPVHADRKMIKQVWFNLIDNALKYTSKIDSPQITIGSIEHEDSQTYYIQDNGIGFDSQQADKLFIPFNRLHNSDEYEGTGIGLATVYRIITKHNGTIWAESEQGKGATFYFSLPKVNIH